MAASFVATALLEQTYLTTIAYYTETASKFEKILNKFRSSDMAYSVF
jgi:hypothetical protein